MQNLKEIVAKRIKELGLEPIPAAKSVGLERGFIRDIIVGRKKSVSSNKITLLAKALQLDPTALSQGESVALSPNATNANISLPTNSSMPVDIPVKGTAAGSMDGKGAFQLSDDVIDYVARAPGIAKARDIYALYVVGESMEPRFNAGDLIFVNPHKPVRVNDVVVIQEPNSQNGHPASFIKIFKRRTEKGIVTEQLNPKATITFTNEANPIMHKVLTINELFGH